MATSLLFTGHMVDLPGRGTPRFPQSLAETARRMIGQRLDPYFGQDGVQGFASLARGGDILFHEECRKRRIPTTVILPFAPPEFVRESVEGVPDTDWQTRFWTMWTDATMGTRESLGLAVSDAAYSSCNNRLLDRARAHGSVHLIALWDGKVGVGPGGTAELVGEAKKAGDHSDVFYFQSCFVVMGFGEKTDAATGRKLNLDQTYKNVIKPAVEAAGFLCVRADEILHSGVIDIPMYKMLFDADLVVADLSTANLNAIFELGVRHALRPRTTIIIAEKQFASPFDVNHIVIRKYEHLGPDIGFNETGRMRTDLTRLAEALKESNEPDSPVYSLLQNLQPPHFAAPDDPASAKHEDGSSGDRGSSGGSSGGGGGDGPPIDRAPIGPAPPPLVARAEDSYAAHLAKAAAEKDNGNWSAAKAILQGIYEAQTGGDPRETLRRPRPRVVQELALATYKAGEKEAEQAGAEAAAVVAYDKAIELLRQLDPAHSTDPETLGLWAGVHKRRAALPGTGAERRRADLDEAIYASERGFLIRQDYYTGINLAYLLDDRASISQGEERIADRVIAKRVRRRVVAFAEAEVATLTKTLSTDGPEVSPKLRDELYWNRASLAEAKIGLGEDGAEELLEQVTAAAPAAWMADTTKKQAVKVAQLQRLLAVLDKDSA